MNTRKIKQITMALALMGIFSMGQATNLHLSNNPFGHALVPDMIADASISYIDGTFYCHATTDGYGRGLETSGPPVVWTSPDFVHWQFNGIGFPSAANEKYWAPSKPVPANGRYYLYPTINGYMYAAEAMNPAGPFRLSEGEDHFERPYSAASTLLKRGDRTGIDAEVFVDDDGQAYVFWQRRHAAKLLSDMVTIDTASEVVLSTPQKAYSEGPIFFKRNNIYYYLYTIGGNEKYKYYYMMSHVSPLGPYEFPANDLVTTTRAETGVSGPGHGCVFNVGEDYYIAFLEFGRGGTNRQTYVNRLEFNSDGTIRPVKVSLDGVGALSPYPYGTEIPIKRITASSVADSQYVKPISDPTLHRVEYFSPQFASDHANGSRWMALDEDSSCWLVADLGRKEFIGRSEIAFVRPTAGHAYRLEGSVDGRKWTLCGGHDDIRIQSPHVDQIGQKYRYLRLKITSGVKGVWEWQIYREGSYTNPILPADFSDIDCIRVGKDYYAISSTFQFSPGMAILHSTNLVDWEICGHAVNDLTQISPHLNWNSMDRYARGIWAGTLRYHKGKFYLVFGTPDEGYFITTASKPEGEWSPLHPLLKEAGWDDCTLDWDESGTPYFVGTCFKDNYKTYLFRMSPDAMAIDRSSAQLLHEGYGREANKLLYDDGWHYLIYSEHHAETGRYVMARRARNIQGPYSEPRRLTRNIPGDNEPNQGGIIEGPNGNWYFLTHHGSGSWYGRAVSLLPVSWLDGWPIPGVVAEDSVGVMAYGGLMPAKTSSPNYDVLEDFDSSNRINKSLEWNYQPRQEKISLKSHPGWLRLHAFRPLQAGNLLFVGNILTARSWKSKHNEVTTRINLAGMTDGMHCGLCHFSKAYSGFGISRANGTTKLEYLSQGETEEGIVTTAQEIWLRSTWGIDGLSSYAYSTDGQDFITLPTSYQLQWGNYRGDRVGIYCYNDIDESGFADFDYLHITR